MVERQKNTTNPSLQSGFHKKKKTSVVNQRWIHLVWGSPCHLRLGATTLQLSSFQCDANGTLAHHVQVVTRLVRVDDCLGVCVCVCVVLWWALTNPLWIIGFVVSCTWLKLRIFHLESPLSKFGIFGDLRVTVGLFNAWTTFFKRRSVCQNSAKGCLPLKLLWSTCSYDFLFNENWQLPSRCGGEQSIS